MMPAIVELRLSSGRGVEPTTRQLHGLACALFEGSLPGSPPGSLPGGNGGSGSGNGNGGHAAQEKPFSVWPLREVPGGWVFRGAWLLPGFPQGVLAACGQVRLGPVACTVTDVAFHPATHAELAGVPQIDGIRLTLLSPAYFSQSGAYVAEPDPRLIAGSWRRRWNASLPAGDDLAVGDELWRDIHLALHVTGSGLRTEIRDTGYRSQAGLTGTMTLRLEQEASAEARRGLGMLARFAEYCGTGAQVTHGFGATKVTLLRSAWLSGTAAAGRFCDDVIASDEVVARIPGVARTQVRPCFCILTSPDWQPAHGAAAGRSQARWFAQVRPGKYPEPWKRSPDAKRMSRVVAGVGDNY